MISTDNAVAKIQDLLDLVLACRRNYNIRSFTFSSGEDNWSGNSNFLVDIGVFVLCTQDKIVVEHLLGENSEGIEDILSLPEIQSIVTRLYYHASSFLIDYFQLADSCRS